MSERSWIRWHYTWAVGWALAAGYELAWAVGTAGAVRWVHGVFAVVLTWWAFKDGREANRRRAAADEREARKRGLYGD